MTRMIRAVPVAVTAAALLALGAAGCTPTVKVKHEVEPIHVTADINIRVDRKLDDFFAYQDQPAAAATQPTTTPAVPAPTAAAPTGDVK